MHHQALPVSRESSGLVKQEQQGAAVLMLDASMPHLRSAGHQSYNGHKNSVASISRHPPASLPLHLASPVALPTDQCSAPTQDPSHILDNPRSPFCCWVQGPVLEPPCCFEHCVTCCFRCVELNLPPNPLPPCPSALPYPHACVFPSHLPPALPV